MRIDFESKPIHGDDDKNIKTKIKIYVNNMITIFTIKRCTKKNHHASVYQ